MHPLLKNVKSSLKSYRLRERYGELCRLVRWKADYSEGVIFSDDHLFELTANLPRTRVVKEAEVVQTSQIPICLPVDEKVEFQPQISFFTNYLIDSEDAEEFYFANCYLFLGKYFFYERNHEKKDQAARQGFRNLLFHKSLDDQWTIDRYQNKYAPLPGDVKNNQRPLISLSNNCNENYFHWMHFPSLINYSTVKRREPELLSECDFYLGSSYDKKLPNYMQEMLTKLKIPKTRLHYSPLRSARMLSCFQFTNDVWISPIHLKFLRKSFLPEGDLKNYPKRIFISREDAPGRRLLNESAIFDMLKCDYGFEKVVLSDETFQKQINCFSQAELIVGAHGAGFSNITFANKNCVLIELFSKNHIGTHFLKMSEVLGIRYGYVIGDPITSSSDSHFSVDVSKLKRLMGSFL